MKNLLIIVISAILFSSCNSNSTKKEENLIVDNSTKTETTQSTTNQNTEIQVIHLTTEDFKQKVFNYELNKEWKYEGTVPCIVDFYADWCGPCKRVAPILDELAKEYDGKIIIYKIDTDKEKELSSAFGISSIPTILFVPMQGEPQAAQGALPKETFVKAINDVLLGTGANS